MHACARGAHSPGAVLDEAAQFFARGALDVALAFRPALLEVAVRALRHDRRGALHTLSQLLGAFEELYPVVEMAVADAREDSEPLDLLAQYRLLRAAPTLALRTPLPALYACFTDTSREPSERLLALEVYALRERLAPAVREELVAAWVGDAPAPLACAPDVRVLPVYEARRIAALWDACAEQALHSDAPLLLTATDVTPPLVLVGGVLLCATAPGGDASFVETPSVAPALAHAALHVALRLPLLVSGPAACGKTHLIHYLAQRVRGGTRTPLLTLQLGDQSGVDGKQLLGSFVSSSTAPGTFEWVEGALARAVRELSLIHI